ncbi:MAG: MMPL family transporter [Phycisphaeraceae bacterium]
MFNAARRVLLQRWATVVCEHPIKVLAITILMAIASVALTAGSLTFQSNRNDLLSDSLDWNQRYMAYADRFAGHNELIAVVRVPPSEAGPARAKAFVDQLASRLESDTDHVDRVWHRIEATPKLMRLLPLEDFETRLEQLKQSQLLLQATSVSDLLARATSSLADAEDAEAITPEQAVAQIDQLTQLVEMIEQGLLGQLSEAEIDQLLLPEADRWQYLESGDGALMFVQIEARGQLEELDPYEQAVAAVRGHIAAARAEMPHIDAGLTGIPVLEADEAAVLVKDSTLASIVAVIAIVVLLLVAFHGWRAPLLMVISLAVGVAWSFGALTLFIGHLQLLSVFFTVILLGLGIDFGIHLVSRFELVRHRFSDDRAGARQAVLNTVQHTGPGILTGAVTTAVAFGVTLLTDFQGMAEMGLIAGLGVLLCMIAMLSVLPALLVLLHAGHRDVAAADVRTVDMHAQGWLMPVVRRPGLTLCLAAVPVLLAAAVASEVGYDNNLMDLYPENLESVHWQQVVMDHSSEAVWSAVSITDNLDEARARTEAFRQLPVINSVGGIGMLFPLDATAKHALAADVREDLGESLTRNTSDALTGTTPDQLFRQLNALAVGTAIGSGRREVREQPIIHAALTTLSAATRRALDVMNQPDFTAEADARLTALNGFFAATQATIRQMTADAISPRPLAVDDLPAYVLRRSVSKTEPTQYVIELFPKQDVWEQQHMQDFVDALRQIDPNVTGVPIQIYESGRLIRNSYLFVGILAFVVVLLLVYLDFLKPLDALLCMVPVTLGFVMMFGAMYAAGVTINPANIIALPLLFGIGVASGVHILHRYQQSRYARPLGLSAGTGKGIVLTNLTTIIAFASLMLASHRGIRGLGFVIAVGVAMTLLACLTVLPALLELRNRYHVLKRKRQWGSS